MLSTEEMPFCSFHVFVCFLYFSESDSAVLSVVEYFMNELALHGIETARIISARAGTKVGTNIITPMDSHLYNKYGLHFILSPVSYISYQVRCLTIHIKSDVLHFISSPMSYNSYKVRCLTIHIQVRCLTIHIKSAVL